MVFRINLGGVQFFMNILIIDNGTIRLFQLKKLLRKHNCKTIDLGEFNPEDTTDFDLILLSGSSQLPILNSRSLYEKEIDLIKNSEKPIIGICLGFELIAHAYGAKIKRMQNKEKGIIEIKVSSPEDIFKDLPNFSVYESHRWVINKLPDELIELARSRDCIEAMKHRSRHLYGFQFHPEMFTKRTCGDEIFNNLLDSLTTMEHKML